MPEHIMRAILSSYIKYTLDVYIPIEEKSATLIGFERIVSQFSKRVMISRIFNISTKIKNKTVTHTRCII